MKAAAAAFAVCACTLWLPVQAAVQSAAPDLPRAESLLKEGRAQAAYDLLQAHEVEFAGTADFDYLLGVAALEAGKPDKASIALERALIVNPNFVGARLDLARAYFELRDYERARLEFRTVLEQDPPPAARETVERYLAEIDSRVQARQRTWTAYLEGTVGYDSNVNTSTSQGSVFVPLFGLTLALAPTSVKGSASYFQMGAGGEVVLPLGDEVGLFTGIDMRYRLNSRNEEYEYSRFDGRVGLQHASGRNLYRATVGYGRFYLDHRYNYESTGGSLEWRHALDERNVVSLAGLHTRLRFPEPLLEGNNADTSVFGGGGAHSFNAQRTTFVVAAALFGRELDKNNRVDGERRIASGRLTGQYGFTADWDGYASASAQFSNYDTENFVFAATRKDKLYELALGAVWRFQKDWSLRPQISYTRNKSNIVIYDYDRYDVSITLRRDFR